MGKIFEKSSEGVDFRNVNKSELLHMYILRIVLTLELIYVYICKT